MCIPKQHNKTTTNIKKCKYNVFEKKQKDNLPS